MYRIRLHQAIFSLGCFFLSLCAISCDSGNQKTAVDGFVLSSSDYALTCDPAGASELSYACQLAYYTNRDRASHPLESDNAAPLRWNDDLENIAAAYSREMCDRGFFDHIDPDGATLNDRMNEAGLVWVKAGENLAKGTDMNPDLAEKMFMNEPSCQANHRGNVLDNDFTDIGVGTVFCGNDTIYTELFATFNQEDLRNDANDYCHYSQY